MTRPTTIHVHVTGPDIAQGQSGSSRRCPIARALRRCGLTGFHVLPACAVKINVAYFEFPASVRRWMTRFDRGLDVKPIRFTLRAAR